MKSGGIPRPDNRQRLFVETTRAAATGREKPGADRAAGAGGVHPEVPGGETQLERGGNCAQPRAHERGNRQPDSMRYPYPGDSGELLEAGRCRGNVRKCINKVIKE